MRCLCPKCARSTAAESELQDFPFRCDNCGALLKSPAPIPAAPPSPPAPPIPSSAPLSPAKPAGSEVAEGKPRATLLTVGRWQAHSEAANSIAFKPLKPRADPAAAGTTEAKGRILRPESLREISRAAARQKALRKAQLRGRLQELKALLVMGVFLVGTLLLGAMALQANTLWHRQAQGNPTGEFPGSNSESASPEAIAVRQPVPDAR